MQDPQGLKLHTVVCPPLEASGRVANALKNCLSGPRINFKTFCGPGYQRFSTEISVQAWCKGSSERECRQGDEVSAMPSRSLGNSELL